MQMNYKQLFFVELLNTLQEGKRNSIHRKVARVVQTRKLRDTSDLEEISVKRTVESRESLKWNSQRKTICYHPTHEMFVSS